MDIENSETPETFVEDKVDDSLEGFTDVDNSADAEPTGGEGKFSGKDRTEVIRAYDELEKKLGTQANELGDMRKAFDDGLLSLGNDEANGTSYLTRAQASQVLLKGKHPDKDEVLKSDDFKTWVRSNVPPEMAVMSDSLEEQGDPSVLSFLMTTFKKSNGKTPSGSNSARMAAPVPGRSSGTSGTKTLTRTELAKMSPEEYERRNDEIIRAYRDGRVK